LKRAIKRDQVITYADVTLPQGRLADTFRVEQTRHFSGSATSNARAPLPSRREEMLTVKVKQNGRSAHPRPQS
jgi:hypothetical protein